MDIELRLKLSGSLLFRLILGLILRPVRCRNLRLAITYSTAIVTVSYYVIVKCQRSVMTRGTE
mgnify:CR=1 FL=1